MTVAKVGEHVGGTVAIVRLARRKFERNRQGVGIRQRIKLRREAAA